jgi:ribulose-5-phosphate 4-epimerase/fuculose-1-phosphate aldolase
VQLVSAKARKTNPDSAEWRARVDLAAAHRLAHIQGFSEGIFNHLTLAVPGKDDRYYQIPFGLHWSEITASCLMEVSYADGSVLSGSGEVEQSAYCIHAPMHRLLPQAAAVFHTHMPYASALARLEDPHIEPIGQTECAFLEKTAYDDTYTGLAYDPAEGERLAGVLGPEKSVLFMANHGVVVAGKSVAEAYDRLYYLERVCQIQLFAMWTGQRRKHLSQAVIDHTIQGFKSGPKYGSMAPCEHHFAALKRMLDRQQPDYCD